VVGKRKEGREGAREAREQGREELYLADKGRRNKQYGKSFGSFQLGLFLFFIPSCLVRDDDQSVLVCVLSVHPPSLPPSFPSYLQRGRHLLLQPLEPIQSPPSSLPPSLPPFLEGGGHLLLEET